MDYVTAWNCCAGTRKRLILFRCFLTNRVPLHALFSVRTEDFPFMGMALFHRHDSQGAYMVFYGVFDLERDNLRSEFAWKVP